MTLSTFFAHINARTNTFLTDSFENTFQCQKTDKVLYVFETSLSLGIMIWSPFTTFNKSTITTISLCQGNSVTLPLRIILEKQSKG